MDSRALYAYQRRMNPSYFKYFFSHELRTLILRLHHGDSKGHDFQMIEISIAKEKKINIDQKHYSSDLLIEF